MSKVFIVAANRSLDHGIATKRPGDEIPIADTSTRDGETRELLTLSHAEARGVAAAGFGRIAERPDPVSPEDV